MPKKIEIIPPHEDIPTRVEAAPLKYKRNELGLLENVDYKFNEDGSVNWRRMIKSEFIVLNKDKKTEIERVYSRNFDELQNAIKDKTIDETDVDDKYKLILLGGLKDLARLRGFKSIKHDVIQSSAEYVAVVTSIEWIGNYETSGETIKVQSLADAHQGNTKGFSNYLSAIAENRGLVRAVRNSLGINIVGQDEIGNAPPEENSSTFTSSASPTSPEFLLAKKFDELNKNHHVSFETLRKHLVEKHEMDFAAKWNSINDVAKDKAYDLLGIIAGIIENKEKKKVKAD